MVRITLFAAAVAALTTSVLAHPTNAPRKDGKFGCAVEPTAEFLATVEQFSDLEATNDNSTELNISRADGEVSAAATLTIPVYFHVVARSNSLSGGYVPASQLTAQLNVMNSNYAPQGIQFALQGTDYTINTSWASDGNDAAMKRQLRKGDYKTLNLYFQYSLGGAFGYCYFPTTVTTGSANFYRDGCNILYTTVPGGTATNFNLGKTVTHEVGHWFGLLHTFQGGCSGTGDGVADTPAQSSSSSGCPTGRDSCPNVAGLDPIHNYMDYSYDSCYEEFTAGQTTRMFNMYNTYRA